jgi:Glycosyltransferase sugar-binding region containing DXD motif
MHDSCRYMIIYWRGGVYADADCMCNRPIGEWSPVDAPRPCSFFVGLENDLHFAQWARTSADRIVCLP